MSGSETLLGFQPGGARRSLRSRRRCGTSWPCPGAEGPLVHWEEVSGSSCTRRSAVWPRALRLSSPDRGRLTPGSHGTLCLLLPPLLRAPVWGRSSLSEPCVVSSARSKSRSPGPVALRCNHLGSCSYVSLRLTHRRGLWSSLESCPPGTPGVWGGGKGGVCSGAPSWLPGQPLPSGLGHRPLTWEGLLTQRRGACLRRSGWSGVCVWRRINLGS